MQRSLFGHVLHQVHALDKVPLRVGILDGNCSPSVGESDLVGVLVFLLILFSLLVTMGRILTTLLYMDGERFEVSLLFSLLPLAPLHTSHLHDHRSPALTGGRE